MPALSQRGTRIAVTLIPLLLVLLHAVGVWPMEVLHRLDEIAYDARLRATLAHTLEPRIVIVDIDEKSLAEVGRWPWPRERVAQLVDRLFDEQQIALLGFDTVFAEPDPSAALAELQSLAQGALAQQPGFAAAVQALAPELDHDARLARALEGRPVVLGYYFTSDRDGRRSGVLPAPVMVPEVLQGRPVLATRWDGFGANIAPLAETAPQAGFFNAITSPDGVVRSLPLLAEHEGQFYESLALAMFRRLVGMPKVEPGFPPERFLPTGYAALESVQLVQGAAQLAIPVNDRLTALIPFRGPGGPAGGSFKYISAADLLANRLAPGELKGKIVLLGTTAPGLLDLRATPVGEVYPGVETHANLLSGLLDGEIKREPDYARGYELVVLVASGLLLALALPLLSAVRAVALVLAVLGAVVGLNTWLYLSSGLVLPLASALVMIALAFALNMSYGYLVESRSKRALAQLFGTYVPPDLVTEMVKDPSRYSMAAATRELTVMFCDMRGFTQLAETLEPAQLQALLNTVFSRLTEVIRAHRGTIDKYMGDCVMAFWGAPVAMPDHAAQAVAAALDMTAAIRTLNREHARQGLPAIGIGIGLNTGAMCVGDMGSDVRRSYTVIGDAVNLAARLEGLTRVYGVDVIASDATRAQVPGVAWQALDSVRVKGKAASVSVFTPLARQAADLSTEQVEELRLWDLALHAWRAQDWPPCEGCLAQLQRLNAEKVLYRLFSQRVAVQKALPFDPGWDSITTFDTK
jgi:adenylate cyclase